MLKRKDKRGEWIIREEGVDLKEGSKWRKRQYEKGGEREKGGVEDVFVFLSEINYAKIYFTK